MQEIDETNCRLQDFFYTYNGIGFSIRILVYPDVKIILSDESPYPQEEISQYYLEFLKNTIQRKYLNDLLEKIQASATNPDDLARIAISLVQRIPYDFEKATYDLKYNPNSKIRYPYEVIFDNKGICCEKSILLAFLLKELGFGAALFVYEMENHMALGIQSPKEFSYDETGYAFVETTAPSIVTNSQSEYLKSTKLGIFRNKLKSYPTIIPLFEGNEFSEIYTEFFDAKEWNNLIQNHLNDEGFFFQKRIKLMQKYGF